MKNNKFIFFGILSALALGVGIQLHSTKQLISAYAETYVTASNLKVNKNLGTNGINYSGDRINGFYFSADANDAPYDDWNIEYDITQDDNMSILKANGTYIEKATQGKQNNAFIVKIGENDHYLKFESWTIGDNLVEIGDTITIRGNFKQHSGGSVIYTMPETSFLVTEQSIEIPDTINKINPTSVSAPEYNDQKWHFQFLAKGINATTMPFTGIEGNDDAYSYLATSKKNIYLNEQAIAKVNKNALRRRDAWMNSDALIYVCNENSGQDFNPAVGDIVTFDGIFVHNNPEIKVGIEFDNLSLIKFGSGVADYESVDLKEYFISDLNDNYNPAIFHDEDVAAITTLLADAETAINAAIEVPDIYAAYNTYKDQLDDFEYDSQKAEQYLSSIKTSAIKEINEYPNLDLYFENERNTILALIETYTTNIQNSTKKSEIDKYVAAFKKAVDNVSTDVEVMKAAIMNKTAGYEQYLEKYDRASLNSLNLNQVTFHGMTEQRRNDLNTNAQSNGLNNLFVPSSENDNGNVIFQFSYETNATPTDGANMMVVLRGMPSYGYKFAIDTSSRGLYLEMINNDGIGKWIGGTGEVFNVNKTYKVEIGAIDLINDVNLTYFFVRVDGSIKYETIQNSFDFCHNPRIAISPNDNWGKDVDGTFVNNDYEGVATISSLNENIDNSSHKNVGSFKVDEDPHSDSKNTIYAKLKENNIKLNANLYPISSDSVTLIRDSISTEIANPALSFINKYNDDSYSLNVKSVIDSNNTNESIKDGDQIVVKGTFVYYDLDAEDKFAFNINKTTFIYRSSSNSWELVLTLEDVKNNAKIELGSYVDLSKYDEEAKQQIQNIINSVSTQIDSATTIEEVNNLLDKALADINKVLTILQKAKNAAINEINQYKADELDLYRQDEISDMENLKQEAIKAVNEASNQEEINAIVIDFKIKVDALKTKAQYEKEELDDAKEAASEEIRNYYSALIKSGQYKDEQLTMLNDATKKAMQDIEDATSIEEVNKIVSDYKSTYKLEENNKPNNNNGWVLPVVISSASVGTLAIAGLVFFLIRKFVFKK